MSQLAILGGLTYMDTRWLIPGFPVSLNPFNGDAVTSLSSCYCLK